MLQDIWDSAFGSYSLTFVFLEHFENQVFGVGGDMDVVPFFTWEVDSVCFNVFKHNLLIFIIERWDSNNHFEKKGAQAPDVDREIVALVGENFWRQITSSSAERLVYVLSLGLLGQAKVRQLQISICFYKDVFGLQISVNDILVVKVLKGNGHLSYHELSLLLAEFSNRAQVAEELTTLNEIHHEEYSVLVLENVVHADQERVLFAEENLFLQKKIVYRVVFQSPIFSNTFHSMHFLGLFVHDFIYFTKCSLSNNPGNLEIVQLQLLGIGLLEGQGAHVS